MIAAADAGGEEHEPPVRAPAGRACLEVPIRGQVLWRSAIGGEECDVGWRAVMLFGRDDRGQAELSPDSDRAAIRRPRGRLVIVAVVGDSLRRAVERDGPEIGAFVRVL